MSRKLQAMVVEIFSRPRISTSYRERRVSVQAQFFDAGFFRDRNPDSGVNTPSISKVTIDCFTLGSS